MSDKPVRTSQTVVGEFNNLAFKAGNLQHIVYEKTKEIAMLNETMATLSLEYNTVKAKEALDEANKKAADASLETPKNA